MGDEYWVAPEDLTSAWANIRHDLERAASGRGNHVLSVSVIANNGRVTAVVQCSASKIEPRRNRFSGPASCTWWSVIRRLRSVAPSIGDVMISTAVTLDAKGNPVQWTEPGCVRVSAVR